MQVANPNRRRTTRSLCKEYDLIGTHARYQQILRQFHCHIGNLKGDMTVITDAFSRVFFNESILTSVSDFLPQSTDVTEHPRVASSTISTTSSAAIHSTAQPPTPIDSRPAVTPTTTHLAISMSCTATTTSQATGMTPITNSTPGSPVKRSYSQALAVPARPSTPFGNTTRAIT